LIYSGMRRGRVTLTQLVDAAEHDESLGPLPPEPAVLVRLARRIERRQRLGLPKKDCAARRVDASCSCLGETLDELPDDASKREVLAAARKLHRARHPRIKPMPRPPLVPDPPSPAAPTTTPPAPVPAAVVSETSTKPFRVVKRSRRWWDGPEGAGGIRDKIF
jgi:hypothetical protein